MNKSQRTVGRVRGGQGRRHGSQSMARMGTVDCLPHWVQAELVGLEAGFHFCLGAGHMEAQGEKNRKRECLCLSPLRLEYHPAYSDK